MIVVAGSVLAAVFVFFRWRRFRLAGQALRADRQPRAEWSARYPRTPFR